MSAACGGCGMFPPNCHCIPEGFKFTAEEASEVIADLLTALRAMLRASVMGGLEDHELNALEAGARAAIAKATASETQE